jgi:hypothetical protein
VDKTSPTLHSCSATNPSSNLNSGLKIKKREEEQRFRGHGHSPQVGGGPRKPATVSRVRNSACVLFAWHRLGCLAVFPNVASTSSPIDADIHYPYAHVRAFRFRANCATSFEIFSPCFWSRERLLRNVVLLSLSPVHPYPGLRTCSSLSWRTSSKSYKVAPGMAHLPQTLETFQNLTKSLRAWRTSLKSYRGGQVQSLTKFIL